MPAPPAAALCRAPGTAAEFEVVELDLTKPKRGEVLIKVEATGLRHSELHMLTGDWPVSLPMGGGHEATGIVEETGPGVGRGRSGTASTVPLFRRPRRPGCAARAAVHDPALVGSVGAGPGRIEGMSPRVLAVPPPLATASRMDAAG
ncbi:alcohol dehydrogenase catalytic domain-containing protein [Streptomyces sp. NRRL WC-3744]|uniref:alcohol dehydrogenase catalytic domain-containing protein n=1 Tax=Streptomyces sp. NRRL WC-3744 TaxID=1463935 RepID=UPI000997BED4